MRTALARLLRVKAVLVAAIAVASLGGVAVAAAAVMPGLVGFQSNDNAQHETGKPADAGHDANEASEPDATPSPSLVGLCHAYRAGALDNNGKTEENPAFSVLITAAGGTDEVASYCTDVLASAPGSDEGDEHSEQAGDHPTGSSQDHPGPSDHPTGRPAE